ncbi:SDR family NAD(P)-dependent oxidoreductase [Ureaplasma ceti]|uniref:SDR family oxidoreductase n=1 Tax=Ureaplasma ceti TaxID=3119530 RepID=A0ABP9U6N8_9BACT
MNTYDLNNKTILLTGCTNGIGKEILQLLLNYSVHLILVARNEQKLDALLAGLNTTKVRITKVICDLSKPEEVEALRPHCENVDVLINNAGYGTFDQSTAISASEEQKMFQTNVLTPIELAKMVLPSMYKKESGQIVFLASAVSFFPLPYCATYTATKYAILGYANALRLETAKHNVNVLTIHPAGVKTNFFPNADKHTDYSSGFQKNLLTPQTVAEKVINGLSHQKQTVLIPRSLQHVINLYRMCPKFVGKILLKKAHQK